MIDCKGYYNERIKSIKEKYKEYLNYGKSKLAIINFYENYDANVYTKQLINDCKRTEIDYEIFNAHDLDCQGILELIKSLNEDDEIKGIIIQEPIPSKFSTPQKSLIKNSIKSLKDIDNCGKNSIFKSATVCAVLEILDLVKIKPSGKVCCVIGRSKNLGMPIVNSLIESHATVINCNSLTSNIGDFIKQSEIIISATGVPKLIKPEWVNSNQVIIDVGISLGEDGKISGDCNPEIYNIVDLITPVPNGLGYVTRIKLLQNFLTACLY